jgi:hypothetical protein
MFYFAVNVHFSSVCRKRTNIKISCSNSATALGTLFHGRYGKSKFFHH